MLRKALLERKSGEGGWIDKRKALLETKSGEVLQSAPTQGWPLGGFLMRLRFLKAAHPQRDDRSNEQITQQAERPMPPTTVLYVPRVEVPCVVALENGNSQAVLWTSARPKFLL
jgi:hypothetical protein